MSAEYLLSVYKPKIIDYSYTWKGKEVSTQKLQVILISVDPTQYCLGVAKLERQDKAELKKQLEKYKEKTCWKFSRIKFLEEKACYNHTACRITIDLRKSTSCAVLQSTQMPKTPEPVCRIADIIGLTKSQRFDLLAIP